jgi:hypothetical protein
LDRFTRSRVAPHTSCTMFYLEGPEAYQ